MRNKTLLTLLTTTLLSGIAYNASAADNQGSGTITFTGSVISAPCSIASSDLNQTVELGNVSDSVLNSGNSSTPVDVSIHLQDCILTTTTGETTTTVDKVKVTFTSSATDGTDTSLMKNSLDGSLGGATGVGVRLLDSNSNKVVLGTPVVVNFANANATQELAFKARMEPVAGSTVTPGSVQAQANYVLDYK
ncbi:fimbrial-like protein [Enterobacter soli]|uniref:fimbrial-like protein n=1 Tax=Enterobacter soli TaxID=885040 RepID=UPI0034CFA07D